MAFHGKVALVTGAASGMGRVAALRLANAGAKVAAVDLDPLSSLAYAAALTDRIQLGTCVRVGDGVPPHHLARALETVDRLSVGRLTVALVGSGEPGAVDPIDEVLDAMTETIVVPSSFLTKSIAWTLYGGSPTPCAGTPSI